MLDSFAESTKSTLRKPGEESTTPESTCGSTYREVIESACIFRLTKLPPLTYPLIIEELRPEDTPRGRFRFPDIAVPDPAAGVAQRASACPPRPT